eukprot:CAMPEP_0114517910 /NCGR_PEP_ID=MMETSP0109-20121206/18156_1 /TAXON_ID=29199 /ORGANISM="Chlorarachnion reptans, Strain CCCM449" /LENGTH=411 /DNA_ID=CAMNT_0001698483 /DNA_START=17 /DNA_END=1252 /DNA_ORIENTATION=-
MAANEAGKRILEHARYGEPEELKKVLESSGSDGVDYKSSNGCSGLHYASVNGHAECVKLLIDAKASHFPNESGNTPLHWATQGKQHKIVKMILEAYKDIDVLKKNEFGKGAMSHAFGSGDAGILKDILSHHSATEERLKSDQKQIDAIRQVTHTFVFGGDSKKIKKEDGGSKQTQGKELLIREKAIMNADLSKIAGGVGKKALNDETGLAIWGASIILAQWLSCTEDVRASLKNKKLIELGAGCGVGGFAVAATCDASSVIVSDLAEETIDNLKHNLSLNKEKFGDTKVDVKSIDWGECTQNPEGLGPFDVVIGSDLVYDRDVVSIFTQMLQTLLKPGGEFFYVTAENRAGRAELISALMKAGFRMVNVSKAGETLRKNPLKNKSMDECNALFSDLRSTEYQLWHLRRKSE